MAWKGIYVGRSFDSPAGLVYNPDSGRVIASRNIFFYEAEITKPLPRHGQ
jgi:hypothetical protein